MPLLLNFLSDEWDIKQKHPHREWLYELIHIEKLIKSNLIH